jgi:hypothetical protein
MVSARYKIRRFSFVDDAGEIHDNVPLEHNKRHFGCQLGFGLLELEKF